MTEKSPLITDPSLAKGKPGDSRRSRVSEDLSDSLTTDKEASWLDAALGALPFELSKERVCYVAELLLVLTFFMSVGPVLILVNKNILKDRHFPYPILVSLLGQGTSMLFTAVYFRVLKMQELKMQDQVTWPFYLKNMGIVGAGTAGSLALGQIVYLYLSVSFIQILKSVTPVLTSILLVAFGIEHLSARVWFCVLMISLGAALASYGEVHFRFVGVAIMLTGSTCEGLRMVLTQKLLVNLKFSALEGLYYYAPITTAWMLLASLLLEAPVFYARQYAEDPGPNGRPLDALRDCAWLMALACVLGVAVNLSSMLMIKYTSSVSLKLLSTARNAGLVLYAVIFGGEQTTFLQLLGYSVCVVFFALYVYAKSGQGPGTASRPTTPATPGTGPPI